MTLYFRYIAVFYLFEATEPQGIVDLPIEHGEFIVMLIYQRVMGLIGWEISAILRRDPRESV